MSDQDPSTAPTWQRTVTPLSAMFTFQTAMSLATLTVPVIAVPLARDLGVPAGWVGFYMTVVFTAAMFGGVAGGGLVLRFGAIRVAQLCLALAALAMVTMTAGVLVAVVLASVAVGVAYGPPTPASSHILARTTPPRLMPLVFSIKQTGVPLGGALAGALVPGMVVLWGWRGAALAVGATALVLAVALQPLRGRLDIDRDRHHPIAPNLLGPLRLVLTVPALRRMSAVSFAYSSVQMCGVAYLVTYLVEGVELDLVTAGLVLAVAQSAGVVGRVVMGGFSGLVLPARWLLMVLGCAMAVSAAIAASFAPGWPLWALYGTAALFGATAIGWNGVLLAELARAAPPGQAGAATAGSVFFTFAGVGLTPGVFSLMLEAGFSYGAGFGMLAVLALGGAVLLVRKL